MDLLRRAWSRLTGLSGSLSRTLVRAYSPSAFLFASVVVFGVILVMTAYVADHYFGIDVASSLGFYANDGHCDLGRGEGVGVHCFGDYVYVGLFAEQQDPWVRYLDFDFNYPAAGMLPHWFFWNLGQATTYQVGLFGYLAVLIAAVLAPAVWAARGKPVAIKAITYGAFGILAVPGLMAIDRGNSVGFAAAAFLALLVALRRRNDVVAIVAICAAAAIKPQFALLLVILFATRKWRQGLIALAGIVVTNLLAFLAWPTRFPATVLESLTNTLNYGSTIPLGAVYPANVSFASGIYWVERGLRWVTGSRTDESWTADHSGLVSAIVVGIVIAVVLVLGRRLPPTLVGVCVIVCASLFPGLTYAYYLVFALPVAAVLLRDATLPPDRRSWTGVLDLEGSTRLRSIAVLGIVLATLGSLTRLLLPVRIPSDPDLILTTAAAVPLAWLVAIILVLIAWLPARRSRAAVPG